MNNLIANQNTGSNGYATAGMILGIIAMVGCWMPILNIVSFIIVCIGLPLACVGYKQSRYKGGKGMAIAGQILNLVALAIILLVAFFFVAGLTSISDEPSNGAGKSSSTSEGNKATNKTESKSTTSGWKRFTGANARGNIVGYRVSSEDENAALIARCEGSDFEGIVGSDRYLPGGVDSEVSVIHRFSNQSEGTIAKWWTNEKIGYRDDTGSSIWGSPVFINELKTTSANKFFIGITTSLGDVYHYEFNIIGIAEVQNQLSCI